MSTKSHMAIHSSDFYYITLIQTYLLLIIFDTSEIMSISPYKIYFVGPITPLPEPRTLGVMVHGTPIYGIGLDNVDSIQGPLLSSSTLTATTSPMLIIP